MSETLLRANELAERLGMSAAWVLDSFEAGELPGFRLARAGARRGAVRFRLSEVEAWLESKRVGPAPQEPPRAPLRSIRPGGPAE